ncbi:MAG: ribosome biogenesis GTPase Der [Armatimonadetes bacterium 13_1_40CM_64_14]|nr:MAG: ribosome biogenesis GTPase Der [Armatimonadetes bacterium 13_1_40CM_64_14]
MSKPVVAIVGRPNVGKSALFNRLVGHRKAIVESTPGVTRDRLYGPTVWRGREFSVIDTGGMTWPAKAPLQEQVLQQAERAVQDADVVLFLVEARSGLLPEDREVGERLRAPRRPVLLVVNKVDEPGASTPPEFYELGWGDPVVISALHGLGINDLLDQVVALLPESDPEAPGAPAIQVAIVGRPNVGKSSLVNAMLGDERVIVDEAPGTTRDAIDTPFTRGEQHFVLVDTAGLRRKARIDQPLERYGAMRSLQAVDRADVVVLVLDASAPPVEQDQEIARYTQEQGRALVLAVNKWDVVSATPQPRAQLLTPIRAAMRFVDYATIVYTSVTRGWGIQILMDRVVEASAAHDRRIATGPLNRAIELAETAHQPSANRAGRQLKIFYATQPATKPPMIVVFVNDPELVTVNYRRYLEGRLRETFDFHGTPIRLTFRPRERSAARR